MSEQAPMPGEFINEQVAVPSTTASKRAPRTEAHGWQRLDYLHVRADGRIALHYHAEITTEDKKIALEADGVLTLEPGSPIALLRNNVALTTAAAEYAWVNPI
jgi:hypothetical protein